jgi:hypothetical protein
MYARRVFRKNPDVARFEVIVLGRYYRQDHLECFRVSTRNYAPSAHFLSHKAVEHVGLCIQVLCFQNRPPAGFVRSTHHTVCRE